MTKFITTIFLATIFSVTYASDIYVNYAASGSASGTSWTDAYTELQDALDNATSGDNIYIAEGTYSPVYTLSSVTTSTTDRDNAFHIDGKNVLLSGGWDASAATQTGDNTILSAEINTSANTDNSYHVFVSVNQSNSAVFENLVFTEGYGIASCNGSPSYGGVTVFRCSGSAVNMHNSSPTFNKCTFTNNNASEYGALVADGTSAPKFTNCLFLDNASTNDAVMHANTTGSPEFYNCSFIDNVTTSESSALRKIGASGEVLVVNCLFFGNTGGASDNFAGDISSSSTNNAADMGTTTLTSTTNYLDLSSQTTATLFVNSASEIGADGHWMTNDDGIMPLNTSVLKQAGTSTSAPSTDIIGETRYSTPTIGAYKSQVLSSTTLYSGNGNSDGKNSVTAPNNTMTLSSFTVPAGDDRVLLVAIIQNHSRSVSAWFGGTAMSKVQTVRNLDVFSLTLGSGSAITGDIVVGGSFFFCSIGAQSFTNIDQTTPIDNITTDAAFNVASGSMGKSVTSATNDLVCDFISVYNGTSSFSISADASQTETFNENSGHHNNQQVYFTLASSIKEGASSVDMDWTFPSGKSYDYIGLNLNIASPAALPVTLTIFEASLRAEGTELFWQTSLEINNKGFEIEHSTDGQNFQYLDFVAGNGNSNTESNYTYVHSKPAQGTNYYRLKQIDYDGAFEYSPVRSLNSETTSITAYELWPNPSSTDALNVSELGTYKVYNTSGQLLLEAHNVTKINVSPLPLGTYIIKNGFGFNSLYIRD